VFRVACFGFRYLRLIDFCITLGWGLGVGDSERDLAEEVAGGELVHALVIHQHL